MNPLQDRLRHLLLEVVQTEGEVTYRELAERLGLTAPQRIRRVTDALEALMADDVASGRPLLAALCVSQRHALPARGFFVTARALGVFEGDAEGPEASAFHVQELRRARSFYRR